MRLNWLANIGFFAMMTFVAQGSANAAAKMIGVFRNGEWFLDKNGNHQWDSPFFGGGDVYSNQFGLSSDYPVIASRSSGTRIGTYRGAGQWFHDTSGNYAWGSGDESFASTFGLGGDLPLAGRWYRAGSPNVICLSSNDCSATVRPQSNNAYSWFFDLNDSHNWDAGDISATYGQWPSVPFAGKMVPGSFVTSIGYFSSGTWKFDSNFNMIEDSGDTVISGFGQAGDNPVVGDWDGTHNRECIGIFRAGLWVLDTNCNGVWDTGDDQFTFGQAGDWPVVGWW